MSDLIDFDVLVIGAGAIGLAAAAACASSGKKTLLVDAGSVVAGQTSSRNSEVIHSGIYYERDSRKEQFCLRGKKLLYDYLRSHKIPYKNCGKILFCNDKSGEKKLKMYYKNAIERGIIVQYFSEQRLRNVQQIAKATDAIMVSDTGIFNSHAYFQHLVADLENHGGILSLNTKVMQIDYQKRKILCECKQLSETFTVRSNYVINVSGHSSLGILKFLFKQKYEIFEDFFVKGHYFSANKLPSLDELYYPMPDKHGLGVHLTIDMNGAVKFGPDTIVVKDSSNYTQEVNTESFKYKVMKNFIGVDNMNLNYSYCGIRPKLLINGVYYNDFMIKTDFDDQLISGLGLESPGLTSSLAIGEYISEMTT